MIEPVVLDIETNIHTGSVVVITVSLGPGLKPQLFRPYDDLKPLVNTLSQSDTLLLGHGVAFDCAHLTAYPPNTPGHVLTDNPLYPQLVSALWDLYKRGRVSDTLVREKLLRCAWGTLRDDDDDGWSGDSFSLSALAHHYLNLTIQKDDSSWQKRFHELEDVPTELWPADAVAYCVDDVELPRNIWHRQLARDNRLVLRDDFGQPTGLLLNESQQCRGHVALQLMSHGGLSTDPLRVSVLEQDWTKEVAEGMAKAKAYFTPARHSATRTMFDSKDVYTEAPRKSLAAVRAQVQREYEARGLPVPRTDPTPKNPDGVIRTDEDTLSICDEPGLQALCEMTGTQKLLTSFLPVLKSGVHTPIHSSYDILKASGRTSAFNPNVQQLPRKGGVRECFVPRPGYVFIQADYAQIELCALAQVHLYMFGRSTMADAIRDGKDLHINTASVLLDRPYESMNKSDPEVKAARQLCKAANFGFPGGMGPEKFVAYARIGYGLKVSIQQANALRKAWFGAYPEMQLYFDRISGMLRNAHGNTGLDELGIPGYIGYSADQSSRAAFTLTQLVSGRIRGNCGFCDGANSYFQGLAAEGAKHALYLVSRECYDPAYTSPLYGCVGGLFVHDEIIKEAPAHRAPEAANRLGFLMVKAMEQYIPDVPIKAEPLIMERLYKDAEPVYGPDGRLIPWRPPTK